MSIRLPLRYLDLAVSCFRAAHRPLLSRPCLSFALDGKVLAIRQRGNWLIQLGCRANAKPAPEAGLEKLPEELRG